MILILTSSYPYKSEHYVEAIEVKLFEKCGFEQNVQWMSNFLTQSATALVPQDLMLQ